MSGSTVLILRGDQVAFCIANCERSLIFLKSPFQLVLVLENITQSSPKISLFAYVLQIATKRNGLFVYFARLIVPAIVR